MPRRITYAIEDYVFQATMYENIKDLNADIDVDIMFGDRDSRLYDNESEQEGVKWIVFRRFKEGKLESIKTMFFYDKNNKCEQVYEAIEKLVKDGYLCSPTDDKKFITDLLLERGIINGSFRLKFGRQENILYKAKVLDRK